MAKTKETKPAKKGNVINFATERMKAAQSKAPKHNLKSSQSKKPGGDK